MNTLIKAVKRAAVDAVRAQKPMSYSLGRVISVDPLKIAVDQKMTLTAAQLILTNTVRDHTVYITVHDAAEDERRIKHRVHLGLKQDEKVILIRCDGGQKFIILDRLEAPDG